MIEEVGGDPGESGGESRATPTTAAGDDEMSDGDDGAEIKQAGGGDTLTANVSNRKSISLFFVWSFALFVCCASCAAFICITSFVVTV